jgi:predicted RNase H-like nuclease (RuvC/YqgF family)
MKVYKDDRGEHDLERRIEKLQLQVRDLQHTIQMYQQILRDAQKQIYHWKEFSYENEKNKNLLQGYKKVIEDLSIKLRKNS